MPKKKNYISVLLFKHFQNTRVIFEEAKLEGLNQSFRESIRKDLPKTIPNTKHWLILVSLYLAS
jgi:hypothetical protein